LADRRPKNNIPTYTGAVLSLCHAMLAQYVLLPCLSVRPSIYPSQAGVRSKRLNLYHHANNTSSQPALGLLFSNVKDLDAMPMESPSGAAKYVTV